VVPEGLAAAERVDHILVDPLQVVLITWVEEAEVEPTTLHLVVITNPVLLVGLV
jgi:hypothetical protein